MKVPWVAPATLDIFSGKFSHHGGKLLSAVSQNHSQAEGEGGAEKSEPPAQQWKVQQISRPLHHRPEEMWLDRVTGPERIREVFFKVVHIKIPK